MATGNARGNDKASKSLAGLESGSGMRTIVQVLLPKDHFLGLTNDTRSRLVAQELEDEISSRYRAYR